MKPLTELFAITGSKAIATKVLPERNWPTPTPGVPAEPASSTRATPSAGGWTVDEAQLLGTSDNSVGAIAGSPPSDVWAFGDFLPDARGSNQDVTLTFAEHYNGKKWTVVRTPNTGPNFNSRPPTRDRAATICTRSTRSAPMTCGRPGSNSAGRSPIGGRSSTGTATPGPWWTCPSPRTPR
ncbi:MAG TPA: hypothetical protein VEF71_16550 [Streptosporangiaceae bacterium]|nr:hypothetical protein [Streptosporangiaceae bacterium]